MQMLKRAVVGMSAYVALAAQAAALGTLTTAVHQVTMTVRESPTRPLLNSSFYLLRFSRKSAGGLPSPAFRA